VSSNEEPIRVDGDVAVVTGAGSGLGRAYALALAARGASVVCNDIVAGAAEATAQAIVESGGSAVAETSSVASPAGGAAIIEAATDAFGSIEIVVNNAGQLRNAAFEDLSFEDIQQVLDTHLAGAFYVTQPAYRHMVAAGYGRIVFTSSSAGVFGGLEQANYAAAKAGVVGLCNVVALEGAAHGIKANAIMPMALGTGMNEDNARPAYSPEGMQAIMKALRPIATYMVVDNVAPLIVYLASRRCAETHRVFSVGAGHVARVFVGAGRGWYGPDLRNPSPEQIEASLDSVCDLGEYFVPESMYEECEVIGRNLPAGQGDR
jgi:NAD(P)-dependent dehydrogenase (short-subunit alcohol dehydrogenase family)